MTEHEPVHPREALSPTQKWLYDAIERLLKTFVQGFLLAWLVFQDGQWDQFIDGDNLKAGLAGGGISLAMSIVGRGFGSNRTAAWLPAAPDTDKG